MKKPSKMGKQPDLIKIAELLKANNLPYEDIISSKVEFITEEQDGVLLGCIGIEKYAEDGLLRSLAVDDLYKNNGIGKKLIDELFNKSRIEGIKKIHLLTTTAEKYFEKYGFQIAERAKAPNGILQSKEFSEICPVSSTYMIMNIK